MLARQLKVYSSRHLFMLAWLCRCHKFDRDYAINSNVERNLRRGRVHEEVTSTLFRSLMIEVKRFGTKISQILYFIRLVRKFLTLFLKNYKKSKSKDF